MIWKVIVCAGAVLGWAAEVVPSTTAPDVHLWHWNGRRALTDAEAADLHAAGVSAFAVWSGLITRTESGVRWQRRGGPVIGLKELPRWSVVRIDSTCQPMLDAGRDTDVVACVRQSLPAGVTGVQIDWDVPSRSLAIYGRFLRALRQALPAGTGLACTGLPAWLGQRDLTEVVAAVDWWVPQAYSNDLPHDPQTARALVMTADVPRLIAACESLGRPYRVGLPSYEQTSHWNAHGEIVAAANRFPLERLLGADVRLRDLTSDGERLVSCLTASGTVIGGVRAQPDEVWLSGMPTVASLHAQVEQVRSLSGPHCQGISIFRLSAPDDLPALSPAQVRAAMLGDTALPDLVWRWEGGPGAWTLVVENRGLADFVALGQPLQRVIPWAGSLPSLVEGGMSWTSAFAGRPASSAHADSTLVLLRFLRADDTKRFPALPIPGPAPTIATTLTELEPRTQMDTQEPSP